MTIACAVRMDGAGGNEMKMIDYSYLIPSVKWAGGITAFIDFSFIPNAYFSLKHNVFDQIYFPREYPVLLRVHEEAENPIFRSFDPMVKHSFFEVHVLHSAFSCLWLDISVGILSA